jgi:hypothetical protein
VGCGKEGKRKSVGDWVHDGVRVILAHSAASMCLASSVRKENQEWQCNPANRFSLPFQENFLPDIRRCGDRRRLWCGEMLLFLEASC